MLNAIKRLFSKSKPNGTPEIDPSYENKETAAVGNEDFSSTNSYENLTKEEREQVYRALNNRNQLSSRNAMNVRNSQQGTSSMVHQPMLFNTAVADSATDNCSNKSSSWNDSSSSSYSSSSDSSSSDSSSSSSCD